jgi:hypothetical protein
MRITKRQLRRLIRESCGLASGEKLPEEELALPELPMPGIEMASPPEMALPPEMAPAAPEYTPGNNVPVPEDYQATRNFLDQNSDLVDMALQGIMDAVGTGCQRSTAQAVVDHMQDMLGHDAPPEDELNQFLSGVITQ